MEIVDLVPRKNPSTGKTFGSNAAANWGYQFRAGFKDGDPREVITIYEVRTRPPAVPIFPLFFSDTSGWHAGCGRV